MVSKAIKKLRKLVEPPSSQRKVAALSKVSQPTICQLVNETHPASAETRAKLNKVLGTVDGDW